MMNDRFGSTAAGQPRGRDSDRGGRLQLSATRHPRAYRVTGSYGSRVAGPRIRPMGPRSAEVEFAEQRRRIKHSDAA